MTDLDKMARELLAKWHLDRGMSEKVARDCRNGVIDIPEIYWELIRAALLTAPPGYVLVPVEPVDLQLMWMGGSDEESQRRAYSGLLSTAAEVE